MAENANVMFKRGKQSALNSLTSYVDGAFYLTTDTDRLYVAQSSTELVELNRSINTVKKLTDLPTTDVEVGQFYYVSDSNILCYYNGTSAVTGQSAGWIQINPDTVDGNDYVSGFSVAKDDTASNASKLVYNWSMTQADKEGTDITSHALSGSFEIASADIVALGGVAVDIDAAAGDANSNNAILSIGGSGADTTAGAGKVTIHGGDNVSVAVSGNTVTVSAVDTNYGLSSAASSTSINLTSADGSVGDAGSIKLEADETYLTVDGTTAGQIKFSHKTQSEGIAKTYGNAGGNIAHEKGSIVIPKITVDAAGHITAISAETFNMPVDNDTTYTAIAATAGTGDNAGKVTFGINDGTNKLTATSEQILYHTLTVDGTQVTKYNTQDLGSFYSASKIDEKLNAVNAMTYKGTVGGDSATKSNLVTTAAATDSIKVGDTYKVAKDGTYGGVNTHEGDLLIATGEETNGVIIGTVTWTYVPSGDYPDTQYTMSLSSNKITLTDSIDSTPQSIEIVGGTNLTATTSGTVADKNAKITISHNTSGVTAATYSNNGESKSLSYSDSFVVPQVTVDAQGHITAISDTTITLPESDDTTYKLVGNATNKTVELQTTEDSTPSGKLTFVEDTAIGITETVSGNTATVTIKHKDVTRTDATLVTAAQSDYAGTFTAVTGVTTNNQGHVTSVATTKFKLPDEVETTATADKDNNKLSIGYGDNAELGSIKLTSNNLTISSTVGTANDTKNQMVTNIDLVWGSF